jgi:ubiquinone/menaquinone biosynthesis C-methylase UbiE
VPPSPDRIDYAPIARTYDLSRRSEPRVTDALAAGLRELRAASVLDVGAGTGNYAAELKRLGFNTILLDLSAEMLSAAVAKLGAIAIRADAHRLPFRPGSFDAAVAVNVLHHLEDLAAALIELRRVVRRGAALQAVVRENLQSLWYRHYFPEMDEVLLPLHPPLGAVIGALLKAGFAHVRAKAVTYSGVADLTFESARTRPELLFDASFRDATSGFRRLPPGAVARGLAELRRDLDAGRFAGIAARYEAAHAAVGDCVIITAAAA